jgi:hypothetical protein
MEIDSQPYLGTVNGVTNHHPFHEDRAERARNRPSRAGQRISMLPFSGVDGEGGNIEDPSILPGMGTVHRYLLLRAGEFTLENPDGSPLGWGQCLDFLCSLPHDRIYVGYFFDYDVNMILCQVPKERYERIYNRHLRFSPRGDSLPVQLGDYEVDYLPHKEFRVRRYGDKDWTIISDVGQFFQSSFLTTLRKWEIGTEAEREEIARGKAERINFGHVTEQTRRYNALECRLLESLMDDFRSTCIATGYVPKKYQGPGYLASAMLDKHHVPKRNVIPILSNQEFKSLANEAYYGGRFETTAAGPVRGPIWQYDINSAYPAACKTLPCLLHGSWRRDKNRPDRGLWFGRVYFHHDGFRYLYNLPFRLGNGNILYPRDGIGVYWSVEIEAAERAGTEIHCDEAWVYESHCDCQWFSFIDAYYAERLRVGKTSKGYVLKLAANSLYGKLAQSIGYAPFANPVWAGLITATCRAQIIDAYTQSPDDCYMIATDGIFSGTQLALECGTGLGQWDESVHLEGMFIVQPGIYYVGDDAKTRGVERGRIWGMRADFQAAWLRYVESHGEHHSLSVDVDNFITCSIALSRRKWDLAGRWERSTKDVSFDWSNKRKRIVARFMPEGCRTIPPDGGRDNVSKPYPRIIGGGLHIDFRERYGPELLERKEAEEQPDWGTTLF